MAVGSLGSQFEALRVDGTVWESSNNTHQWMRHTAVNGVPLPPIPVPAVEVIAIIGYGNQGAAIMRSNGEIWTIDTQIGSSWQLRTQALSSATVGAQGQSWSDVRERYRDD